MRIALILFLLPLLSVGQTPCEDGFSAGFPCNRFEFLSQLTLQDLSAGYANDSWGWTDPDSGKEYALVGLNNGTAFVDITDPVNPLLLGKLPTHTDNSTWRDVKVYANHAFIVSEADGHGMQVFDLTRLRNVDNPPVTFTEDAHYDQFGDAHNIVINEDSGYAYAVGTATFNGGPHFINIQDPTNPQPAGGYAMSNYSHDAQVVTYNGPDADYQGKEILIGSNADEVVLVDITDKDNPELISTTGYTNIGYTHQGWFTEDQRYFLLGDEGDEFIVGFNTRTVIFDFSDLDNPFPLFEYFGTTAAVDHNGYVKGDRYYLANYEAGLRVMDISNISNLEMEEVGYFDTYPASDNASYNGSWNVYPFFESRTILITGEAGMTLALDPDELLDTPQTEIARMEIYPNPAKEYVFLRSENEPIRDIEIVNTLGQIIRNFTPDNSQQEKIAVSSLNPGMYLIRVNNNQVFRLVIN